MKSVENPCVGVHDIPCETGRLPVQLVDGVYSVCSAG